MDGPHVLRVAILLCIDAPAHGRLADNVQGTVGYQRKDVNRAATALVRMRGQFNDENVGLVVHDVEKVLQDAEVECGREQFAASMPLGAPAGQ